MLRDNVHFVDEVFEVAAQAIALLGATRYSALHVRRNDLQYTQSWVSAEQTLQNIRPLLLPGETLYLATDETNHSFFDAFRQEHRVVQFADLFEHGPLRHVVVPPKLIGCIEQVICTLGRRFVGTQYSTFSSYITRLRGYIHAPDTLIYDHNLAWSADDGENRLRAQGSRDPEDYLEEDPQIWKDTVDSSPPSRSSGPGQSQRARGPARERTYLKERRLRSRRPFR